MVANASAVQPLYPSWRNSQVAWHVARAARSEESQRCRPLRFAEIEDVLRVDRVLDEAGARDQTGSQVR